MENTNKIKVQIEVEEYDDNYYKFDDFTLLHKSVCTVVLPPSVEETEGEVKGLILKVGDTVKIVANNSDSNNSIGDVGEVIEVLGKYARVLVLGKKDYGNWSYIGDVELVEPCTSPRTPIGEIDGKPVYEGDTVYHILLNKLEIIAQPLTNSVILEELEEYSKCYRTPEAANARLLEEVEKKAKERKFSFKELEDYDNDWFILKKPIGYAIELIEKEFNVRYL